MPKRVNNTVERQVIGEDVEVVEIDGDEPVTRKPRKPAEELMEAIVAEGRTVEVPITGKKCAVGVDKDGKTINGPVFERVGPGRTVRLEAAEVARLRKLGFLVDPNRVITVPGDIRPAERVGRVNDSEQSSGVRITGGRVG
jgi:hypothetical protein